MCHKHFRVCDITTNLFCRQHPRDHFMVIMLNYADNVVVTVHVTVTVATPCLGKLNFVHDFKTILNMFL